jgi:hypothetical protein
MLLNKAIPGADYGWHFEGELQLLQFVLNYEQVLKHHHHHHHHPKMPNPCP